MGNAWTATTNLASRRGAAVLQTIGFIYAIALAGAMATPSDAQSGTQTINGTQVFTVVDQSAGVATFSNSCGSQTLTQRQLQQGAIPSNIIPCPRSGGSAGAYVPSGGGNNLAVGLSIFSNVLGAAKAFQDPAPSGGGSSDAAYAPPPTTGSIDHREPTSAPQSLRGLALFDKAAAQNREKQYCAAAKLFEKSAAAFRSDGDERRGADAAMQAAMAGADCADAVKREAEKYVYYCVDEDNVYGKPAWIPKRPEEGCGPHLKERRAPKGGNNGELKKQLHESLKKQLAEDAAKGSGGGSSEQEQLPWTKDAPQSTEADAQPTDSQESKPAAVASDDDPHKHYMAIKKNGYSNGGEFDPQEPGTEGLTPAENALRDAGE